MQEAAVPVQPGEGGAAAEAANGERILAEVRKALEAAAAADAEAAPALRKYIAFLPKPEVQQQPQQPTLRQLKVRVDAAHKRLRMAEHASKQHTEQVQACEKKLEGLRAVQPEVTSELAEARREHHQALQALAVRAADLPQPPPVPPDYQGPPNRVESVYSEDGDEEHVTDDVLAQQIAAWQGKLRAAREEQARRRAGDKQADAAKAMDEEVSEVENEPPPLQPAEAIAIAASTAAALAHAAAAPAAAGGASENAGERGRSRSASRTPPRRSG